MDESKAIFAEDTWQTVKEAAAFAGGLAASLASGAVSTMKSICKFEARVLNDAAGIFEMAERGLDEVANQLLDYSVK